MKALMILATTGLAAVIGSPVTPVADQTARLTNPANVMEPLQSERKTAPASLGGREKMVPPSTARLLGLSEIEQHGIREAIRGQMRALAARDAEHAFSYLAPATKDYFSEGAVFLRMMMMQVKPLADASAYSFSDIGREATDAIQNVVLADREGRQWLARFTLERQPDGSWRIKNCVVEPTIGNPI